MDSSHPLTRLTLAANSVADDLGFVALADLSRVLRDSGRTHETRIIGGHMVMLHVQRWGLGKELYRESQDADLGIAPIAVKDSNIIKTLLDLGYKRDAGNRFVRRMDDLPIRLEGSKPAETSAAIDILTPAYTSRARQNVKISDELTTTEVPGLASALIRPGLELDLELHRLNGDTMSVPILVPDEVSAVVLKALAWRQRSAQRDAIDTWRTLEVAFAAGLARDDFQGAWSGADEVLRDDFAHMDGAAMKALAQAGSLGANAIRERHTRLRALIQRFVPAEPM